MTTTHLYSLAHGVLPLLGDEQCALCGGSCDSSTRINSILSDSFTDWQHVHGDFLCAPCLLTLRADERVDQPRLYSWVLTENSFKKYTKANLLELRDGCLNPPPPPYSIVLAESGQRHLLYRAAVCFDSTVAIANLEGQRIDYLPADLAARLDLCGRIVAATGKGALAEYDPTGKTSPMQRKISLSIALAEYWRDWETLFEQWASIRNEPLSTLAAWLCENREQCRVKYPTDTIPLKQRKEKKNDGSTSPPLDPDAGEIPADHRGSRGPRREPGESGLFGRIS